ncbi:GspH/FimT family pseudopilin [Thiolapillus brandeum]|nr:GspH/FimT family pseudopilin [Thiolapillus brandeum]
MDFRKGITLIEVMVTVATIGILTSLAIPSLSHLRASNTMATSLNLFLSQLQLARSTAVTREHHITLCPASSPTACGDDTTSWAGGYLIFEDSNKNGEPDADEEIVSHTDQGLQGIRIRSSRYRSRISFLPQGRSWFSNATIHFCHPQYPDLNRKIIVSNNGRIRKENDSGTTCTP